MKKARDVFLLPGMLVGGSIEGFGEVEGYYGTSLRIVQVLLRLWLWVEVRILFGGTEYIHEKTPGLPCASRIDRRHALEPHQMNNHLLALHLSSSSSVALRNIITDARPITALVRRCRVKSGPTSQPCHGASPPP